MVILEDLKSLAKAYFKFLFRLLKYGIASDQREEKICNKHSRLIQT